MTARAVLTTVSASLTTFIGGSLYTYGVWAPHFKDDCGLSQTQTNAFGGILVAGGSVSALATLRLSQWSQRLTCAASAALGALAYALLGWLSVDTLNDTSVWVLYLLATLISVATIGCFFSASAAMGSVHCLGANSGNALIQSVYGAGGAIWAMVLHRMGEKDHWQNFCRVLAVTHGGLALVGLLFFPAAAAAATNNKTGNNTAATKTASETAAAAAATAATANDFVSMTSDGDDDDVDSKEHGGGGDGGSGGISQGFQQEDALNVTHEESDGGMIADDGAAAAAAAAMPKKEARFFTVALNLLHLLWFGCSLVLLQNSGTIMDSLSDNEGGSSQYDAVVITVWFSVFHAVGKLASLGFVSRTTLCGMRAAHYKIAVVALQPLVALAPLSVVHAVLFGVSSPSKTSVLWVIALTGLSYGVCWNSVFHVPNVMVRARSRSCHVALLMFVAPGFGPVIFNVIAGELYGLHAVDDTCVGHDCYADTYAVMGLSTIVCVVLAAGIAIVGWRRRKAGPFIQ
jgi:hypothetical protein